MGRLSNNHPPLSGKIGDYVYRIRNGKVYVTTAPQKYKISKSPAAKSGREKFFFFVKLAKAIQSNFMLELAWLNDPAAKGGVANKVLKIYYKLIEGYNLSNFHLAYCKNPFKTSLSSANLFGVTISIVLDVLSEGQNISIMKTPAISAQGFIYLYNPAAKKMKDKFFFYSSLFR